jgi:hypothetical protein
MSTPVNISEWLVAGPIFNLAHQSPNQHSDQDGHPTSSDIITDIDANLGYFDPKKLTEISDPKLAVRNGAVFCYGNSSIFENKQYVWRRLCFQSLDWDRVEDIGDNIHCKLYDSDEPETPEFSDFLNKNHALVFFLVYIRSPDQRSTPLSVRSDDGNRLWLNGAEIDELWFDGDRDISQESTADISLHSGWNCLLAAVAQRHMGWGFSVRFPEGSEFVFSVSPSDEEVLAAPDANLTTATLVHEGEQSPSTEQEMRFRGLPQGFEEGSFALSTALRLLGFLRKSGTTGVDLADAKRMCRSVLSMSLDSVSVSRLFPVLEQRGFMDFPPAPTYARAGGIPDQGICLVAGNIWPGDLTGRITAEVWRTDLNGEVQEKLARAIVTDHGQFVASFSRNGLALVSIRFIAGGELLHESTPAVATDEMWIEWSASGDSVPAPGHFSIQEALLRAALKPHGVSLEKVDESSDRPMLGALTSLTGIPIERVRQHIIAAKLAAELGISSDIVNALMGPPVRPGERRVSLEELESLSGIGQKGLDLNEHEGTWDAEDLASVRKRILAQGAVGLAEAVRLSVASGEISARVRPEVPNLERKIAEIKAGDAVSAAERTIEGHGIKWGQLLEACSVPQEQIQELASALSEGRADPMIEPFRSQLSVAALANYDPRAVQSLRNHSPRKVARLSDSELHKLLADKIDDQEERRGIIDTIQRRSDSDYPGDALLRQRWPKLEEATRLFLAEQGDAFDLIESFVDEMVFSAPGKDEPLAMGPKPSSNRDELLRVRGEILRLQRVARVARQGGIADALLEKGYDSAQQIAFTNPDQLVQDLESEGINPDDARRIHRRARAHYRATVEKYLRFNPSAGGPAMTMLPAPAEALAANPRTATIPTYEYLFESQDYAVTEDWESVTSPGAYLVDLLIWLNKAPKKPNADGPYKTLVARRPDIVAVKLDRKNTETLVPHIDLVCELLEDTVAERLGLGRNGEEVWQTSLTAEEIRAYPEHVNTAVYDALRSSKDAMSLPFDLSLQEVRAYLQLKQIDDTTITRPALVSLFGSSLFEMNGESPTQGAKDAAAEIMDLSKTDFEIIANAKGDDTSQTAIWGNPLIKEVVELLRRAPAPSRPRDHITYDELLSLLFDTGFINPQTHINLKPSITVDSGRADERIFEPPLGSPVLDRLHRLLRLARKVPYSFRDLDLLISGLGFGKLDGPFLCKLAAVMGILNRLALTVEEAAAFFRDFNQADVKLRPDGSASLYYRIFLLRTDADEIPNEYKEETQNPTTTLRAEEGRICAALKILTEDFVPLLAATQLDGEDKKVNFHNLSILYRYVRLAQLTSGPSRRLVTDFSDLVKLLGNPFESVESLTKFLDAVALIDRAGLTMSDIRILSGVARPALPAIADFDKALGQLRQETEIQLRNGGQPSDRAAVDAEIVRSSSWIGPVTTWIGLDARLAQPLGALGADSVTALLGEASEARDKALDGIARLARLITVLRVTPLEAEAFSRLPGFGDWLQSDPLTWQKFTALLDAAWFAREASTVQKFADYASAAPGSLSEWAGRLAAACDLDTLRTQAAWIALDGRDPTTRQSDVPFLDRVRRAVRLSAALGVEPGVLQIWATSWPDSAQARNVRNAVRATLSRANWLARSTEVQNSMRALKRDALVDYLVATSSLAVNVPQLPVPTTVPEFSGRYLIDVEMGPGRDTSRIIQACAAVQLLVERCLLGLEADVLSDASAFDADSFWRQWAWRKRYRLWEANRRIYLYPENYLDLSNRSDASPLFKDFEKKVVETEITEESVSAALENYLVGLEKISRLDYLACDGNLDSKVLGVVACSAANPPTYYYRRLLAGRWSPWEEISLGPSPGSLSLAQGNPRAWVIWPTAIDHVHPEQTLPPAKENPGEQPVTVYEQGGRNLIYLHYAWTLRDDHGSWSPVRTTSRALLMSGRALRNLVLTARADSPSPRALFVQLWSPDPNDSASTIDDKVFWTSTMHIARDTTYCAIQPRLSALTTPDPKDPTKPPDPPDPKKWKGDYAEYRLNAEFNYVIPVSPWGEFHFDANRLVIGKSPNTNTQPVTLIVPAYDEATKKPYQVSLLSVKPPIWVTKSRPLVRTITDGQAPAADAFYVCGGSTASDSNTFNWSLMVLSPKAQAAFLSDELRTKPSVPPDKFLLVPSYHPFANELLTAVRDGGFRAIYNAQVQEKPGERLKPPPLDYGATLGLKYETVRVLTGGVAAPIDPAQPAWEALDFDAIAPYSLYNYETFLFAPLYVALKLSAAMLYSQAQAFFHFIFNPLTVESGDSKTRFWVTKPFRERVQITDIQSILEEAAAKPPSNPWSVVEEAPFDAHAVAVSRPAAYQKYVVKCYLDNLMAWGDGLYRQGGREDIDEAIPIYQLAQTILGPRPNQLSLLGRRPDRAFVKPEDWFGGSNLLVELESLVIDAGEEEDTSELVHLPLVRHQELDSPTSPKSLYFRVPPNRELLDYWDKVEGRLRNIRLSLTIDGAVAPVPLLAARIEPKALADAAALGLSVADAIAMATAAPPPYRFRTMLSRVQEHCNEVKALGAALLAALEKRDGEQLAAVRSQFEEPILSASRAIKVAQRRQTEKEVRALELAKAVVVDRRRFYSEREYMNDLETAAFVLSNVAGALDAVGAVLDLTSGGIELIPDITVGVSGFGGTPQATVKTGGTKFANSASKWAQGLAKLSHLIDRSTTLVSTQAGYQRRKEDWDFQASQASLEQTHMDEQIAAARLRLAVLDAEMQGQNASDNAWRQTDRLLREKFTNQVLYDWYAKHLVDLFRRAYEQASQLASTAYQCFVFETGKQDVPRPPMGAWDRLKSGLLVGESLSRYLGDLEIAYLSDPLYKRIITTHVSLRQIAPLAFVDLILTGSTGDFTIPAWCFKRLYPGIQKRRIRSLSVSIPCVTGPYVSVNATLEYRGNDPTVIDTICLSAGNNDYGWDVSSRAECYMPFEGVSLDRDTSWSLRFPDKRDLDVTTIADVVLHFEYAADEGADDAQVPQEFQLFIDFARTFPDAWQRLLTTDDHTCSFEAKDMLPSFLRGYQIIEVQKLVVMDVDGKQFIEEFESEVKTAEPGRAAFIQVHGTDGTVLWTNLRSAFIVLKVRNQP